MKWTDILTGSVIAALSLTTACSNSDEGESLKQYDLHAAYYLSDPDAENAEEQTVILEDVFKTITKTCVMAATNGEEAKDQVHTLMDQVKDALRQNPVEVDAWLTLHATEKTTAGEAEDDPNRPVQEQIFYTQKVGTPSNGQVMIFDIKRPRPNVSVNTKEYVRSLRVGISLSTWCLKGDLNHCTVTGKQLFLNLGDDSASAEGAITDVIAVYTDGESHPADLQIEGRNYQPASEQNLNEGTSGKHVWLYQTTDYRDGYKLKGKSNTKSRILVSPPNADAAPDPFEAKEYISDGTSLTVERVVMAYDASGKLLGEANFNEGNPKASIVKLILCYRKE